MKKLFALVAVAGLVFAIGCTPESKPVKVETKKDDGTKTVEAEVAPGEKAEIKVDAEGAKVEVTPETPKEEPKEEPKVEEAPKEEPKAEAPKEEPKAEEAPKEEPK
jgi:hypothetical protein